MKYFPSRDSSETAPVFLYPVKPSSAQNFINQTVFIFPGHAETCQAFVLHYAAETHLDGKMIEDINNS